MSASQRGGGFVLWWMRWHRVPGSAHLYVCVPVVSEGPGIQAHFCVCLVFNVFSVSYLIDPSLRVIMTAVPEACHSSLRSAFSSSMLMFRHARIWESMESGREPDRGNPPCAEERKVWNDSVCFWYKAVDNWGFVKKTSSHACKVVFQSHPDITLSAAVSWSSHHCGTECGDESTPAWLPCPEWHRGCPSWKCPTSGSWNPDWSSSCGADKARWKSHWRRSDQQDSVHTPCHSLVYLKRDENNWSVAAFWEI